VVRGTARQAAEVVAIPGENDLQSVVPGKLVHRSRTNPTGRFAMPTANELYDLAVDLRDGGDKPGAITKLEEAVTIDPKFAIGHGMLAKLYADLAETEKAIEHARKVVEIEPEDAFSYTALSVIYQRCGRIPEAEHAKAMAYQKQMGFE
jgi:Tfp pilus assembly protein PilF